MAPLVAERPPMVDVDFSPRTSVDTNPQTTADTHPTRRQLRSQHTAPGYAPLSTLHSQLTTRREQHGFW